MPKLCLSVLLVGAELFSVAGVAPFPVKASLQGTLTQSIESMPIFWEEFKSAVIKGDKEAVASLSRFPIWRGEAMGNVNNKAQLKRRFREVFFAETNAAQCFPKAKPVIEKDRPREFAVTCPFASDAGAGEPFVYTFTRIGTGWKFTSFENINE